MSAASPTPAPAGLGRRTSQRQALRRIPSRSTSAANLSRAQSAASAASASQESQSQSQQQESQSQPQVQQQKFHDDSSEDEIFVPMKLSALTKALLNTDGPQEPQPPTQPSPPRTRRRASNLNSSTSSATERRRHLRSGSASVEEPKAAKPPSPEKEKEPSPPRKRVVRLSHAAQSLNQIGPSKRRSTSTTRSTQRAAGQPVRPASRTSYREKPAEEEPEPQPDINTPNQQGRVVRIAIGSSGNRSRIGSLHNSSSKSGSDRSAGDRSALEGEYPEYEDPEAVARDAPLVSMGSMARYPSSSYKNRQEDIANPQSSMRVKRVGKLSGTFLSGPARRGLRRQSEEDGHEHLEGEGLHSSQENGGHLGDDPAASSFYGDVNRDFHSGSPVSGNASARASQRNQVPSSERRSSLRRSPPPEEPQQQKSVPEPLVEHEQAREISPRPALSRPELPSARDQENDIPMSLRRPKPAEEHVLDKVPNRPMSVDLQDRKASSPERKPLAALAQKHNTPHRAPPPPPKMSLVETATATAGAATTTQVKQRRNVLKVNGKPYTRLDCLGRGGSAKVYRVTAENGKMHALKRVSLEHADALTIKGFRGEIDLLTRLASVERVINLIDYEMNEEKKMLTLVMEMGELDMNSLLKDRYTLEEAKLDTVFVRHYWKEMLECLSAVHQHDVVHSDLKPANFVLVKGRLKLIDFGIANAIQTDETVNIHRETQIGTINFMSPESLLDSNSSREGRVPGRPKLMKLGKPSDVWSLGCILYQMVYGAPPFNHIPNYVVRCQAIINWDHAIEFPSRGLGGVTVPPSLIRTMKRCLLRDQHMRPTCEELLHETDPFLHPAELGDKGLPIDEELLGRIIQSVVTRCRERMPTESESKNVWPQAYWASIRKATGNRS
ncbi:unnamed protein product [Clonostachys rosea]|uniref:Protein kinase domain-containing protein n=1 Tax=Bionectria ochroleuca TaxID=29856 RepID=A0ABY6TUJ2_BIOOC|nr:unnamed protein product [Clonostachys rosea]